MCLDYGVLPRQEDDVSNPDYGVLPRQDGVVSGLWRAASPGGWCVWIMACCLAWRMVCLDYGVLSCLEDGVVSGLWRAALLGVWCVWIMACCLARRMVCLDYGVLPRLEDTLSEL